MTEDLNSDRVPEKLTKVKISQQYYNPERGGRGGGAGCRVGYYSGRLHPTGPLSSFGVPQGFRSGVLVYPYKQRSKVCHTSTLALKVVCNQSLEIQKDHGMAAISFGWLGIG